MKILTTALRGFCIILGWIFVCAAILAVLALIKLVVLDITGLHLVEHSSESIVQHLPSLAFWFCAVACISYCVGHFTSFSHPGLQRLFDAPLCSNSKEPEKMSNLELLVVRTLLFLFTLAVVGFLIVGSQFRGPG